MNQVDYQVRWARPRDARFIGQVILMAGRSHVRRGIWDIIIGGTESRRLDFLAHLAITDEPHMCHYSTFLVAEMDGRPQAALSGFDPVVHDDEGLQAQISVVMKKMGLTQGDMATDEKALAAFLTCRADAYNDAYIVENVATLPESRRNGLMCTLLSTMIDLGRTRGFRAVQASFYIGNTSAQLAYESVGFKYYDEKRNGDFEAAIGCPGIMRFLIEF